MFERPTTRGDRNAGFRNPSNGSVNWRNATEGSPRKAKFRSSIQKTKATMNSGNLYEGVLVPPSEDGGEVSQDEIHEWLAESCIDMYNEISVIYGIVIYNNPKWDDICAHPQNYPNRGYPSGVQYTWKLPGESRRDIGVGNYCEAVLGWLDEIVTDEEIFPTSDDVEFPDDFTENIARKMIQRLFRILAIILDNPCLNRLDVEPEGQFVTHLKFEFKRLLYFGWHWGLLDDGELQCISSFVEPMRSKYEQDRDRYERIIAKEKLGTDV